MSNYKNNLAEKKQLHTLFSTTIVALCQRALSEQGMSDDIVHLINQRISANAAFDMQRFYQAVFKQAELKDRFQDRFSQAKAYLLYVTLIHHYQAYHGTLENMTEHYHKLLAGHLSEFTTYIDDMVEYSQLVNAEQPQYQVHMDDSAESSEEWDVEVEHVEFVVANPEAHRCETNLHSLRDYIIKHMDPSQNLMSVKLLGLKIANTLQEELRSGIGSERSGQIYNLINIVQLTLHHQTTKNANACIKLASELCQQMRYPRMNMLGGLLKRLGGAILQAITKGKLGKNTLESGQRLFAAGKAGLVKPQLVQELQQLHREVKKPKKR